MSSATSKVLNHHVNYADDHDYLDAVVQTYSRVKPQAGYNARAFGRCDVATLQLQYDVPSSAAKYSTCLDLDDRPDAVMVAQRQRDHAHRAISPSSTRPPISGWAGTLSRGGP